MTFRYRSAITGRYVSAAYAAEHPETTIREAVQPKPIEYVESFYG
jgi:hypothetical protein